MHIVVVGLSHKTAPVEIREKLAIPESRMGEALSRLCSYQGVREGVLLSTCNRVEVYAVVDEIESGYGRVQDFLADAHLSLSSEQLTPHLYWQEGDRAISHLFRVASSLDSMIVGESQILGQIKEAFEVALTHKATGIILNKVMKKAISVAKRVRTETKISEMAVSVSYAAVELAKKIFSDLSEKTVLLVGAGEMAKLAAKHFIANGVRHVRVTTRNPQHAQELANRFGGTAVAFEDFREDMASADIVLVSTGAAHYLVSEDDVQHSVKQRMNRPMFLIDISVPRNIDPAVRHVDNAFLFDIDDLKTRVERNRGERLNEAEKAEKMVVDEVGTVRQWLQSLEVTPTIVALRARIDEIKRAELDKTLGRLSNLSETDRALVEAMASSIANKLIHNTMRETSLAPQDFIYPLFVVEGRDRKEEIASMPGQFRLSVDLLVKEASEVAALGISAIILFGIPDRKDDRGSSGFDPNGIVQRAVKAVKDQVPGLMVVTDVCIDEYTDHGHCGIVKDGRILNDETLECLRAMARTHALAGADMVAPSDMMDGRVAAIRSELDQAGFPELPIMAYAAKFASCFYAPFRDAAFSSPQFGDRQSYQMDPANRREALREIALDVEEGADIIMVKPALPYLDIIAAARAQMLLPVAAYQVSGEYSMIKAAANAGWLDESRAMMESLLSIKRAGANLILTYFAKDAARLLR
ncbi:MAG: glutamyl-tRNA reductase [Nitrospira sp.]|nr:MAG: glutamyl-tRNA reductase [Nitrospira sp.]